MHVPVDAQRYELQLRCHNDGISGAASCQFRVLSLVGSYIHSEETSGVTIIIYINIVVRFIWGSESYLYFTNYSDL